MMAGTAASDLFAAVKKGDVSTVQSLAEADPSLLDEREAGATPLLTAYYYGRSEVADWLRGARPPRDVFEAAAAGDAARVRDFVARDPSSANAYAEDGFHPLGLAAFFKRREAVRILLEAGADPKPASRQGGFTALHSAVATDAAPCDVEIVRMLVESGADPSAQSASGGTPLHSAAFTGDRAVIDLLLDRGADVSVRNAAGRTAAEIARERGNDEIAGLLTERA